MLFNQKFEFKIFASTIIIVKLRLIKFYNYDNKMLSIMNEKSDNKVLIFFFKGFLKLKRQF